MSSQIVEGYVHLTDAVGQVFAREQCSFEVTDEELINILPIRIHIPERMDCTLPLSLSILLPVGEVPVGDPDKREMPDFGTDLLLGAGTISRFGGGEGESSGPPS